MRRTIIDAVRAHAQGHIEKAKANVVNCILFLLGQLEFIWKH